MLFRQTIQDLMAHCQNISSLSYGIEYEICDLE